MKRGITFASFISWGKIPSNSDKLQICVMRGHIWGRLNWRIEALKLSYPGNDFFNDDTSLCISCSVAGSRYKLKVTFAFMNCSWFLFCFSIHFARFGPTLIKISLNLSLINCSSFVIEPSLSLNFWYTFFVTIYYILGNRPHFLWVTVIYQY